MTEHAIGGVGDAASPTGSTPHDVMVVSTYGGQEMKTLSEALASTRGGDPPVASPMASELAHDKKLVGALDSACNRTVTGFTWLHGFLDELKKAPASVQSLVKRESENELFRFGNGGVQHSHERWRLPMVVGDQLILLWTSVVGVPSLGLLLGRDFLDGIGAVLSFTQRLLRCDHLNSMVVPLRQMAAGHFLLQLIPLQWKRPDEGRWRRLGQDGIIEMQISAEDWVKRKFGATKGSINKSHEHLVTENSVLAADLSNSGLDGDGKLGSVVGVARDAMTVTALRSPTSSTSPTTRFSQHDVRAGCVQGRTTNAPTWKSATRSNRPAVAKVHGKVGFSPRLAHPGCFALVAAAAYFAMGPTAVPIGGIDSSVEGASRGYGPKPHHGPASSSTSSSSWSLHNEESARWSLLAKPLGPRVQLLGGQCDGDGNEGCKKCQRHEGKDSPSSHVGSKARGKQGKGGWSSTTGRSRVDRPSWGSSHIESRSAEACCPVECGVGREGHGGTDQETSQANGGFDDERYIFESRLSHKDSGHGAHQATLFTTKGSSFDILDNYPRPAGPHGRVRDCSLDSKRSSRHCVSSGDAVPRFRPSSPQPHDVYAVDGFRHSSTHVLDSDRSQGGSGDVLPRGGCTDECRSLRVHEGATRRESTNYERDPSGRVEGDSRRGGQEPEWNPFTLNQEVKKGVAQLVAQAWSRHEKERGLISKSHKEIYEVLKKDWFRSMEGGINEAFISSVSLEPPPLVSEIFTTTQRVQKEAERRGHSTGTAMSLETGWNFLLPEHRERAKEVVREEKPFFLMIAFPCNPWSALLRLNSAVDLERIRADGLVLVKFSLELAEIQIEGGRHYALENPLTSEAWRTPEMEKFFNEHRYFEAIFDQCQFNLRGRSGHLHKKATKVISSSGALRDELDGRRCLRDHQHEPVIGGSSVTRPAGHYPSKLARCLVKGMEVQFDEEMNKKHDVNVASAEGGDGEFCFEASDSDDGGATTGTENLRVPGAVKTAIRRLHENTGHRSNLRLARALAISGAPPMVVHAAKVHRCSICDEKRAPQARRPASLPTPKDAGDQANVDMIEIFDAAGNKFYAIHMIDYATRFQMAEVLPNKSTTQVLSFIRKRWLPVFGAPRVLVADQGREFISWEFEEFCSAHSILLWHCGVGAPWQNGICERAGGTLKVILAAVVASHQIFGFEALEEALGEAVGAYNNDVNESGVSPAQAAIGKQPKMLGDVLGGGFSERLAEHSLVDSKPSIARQVALRETAKVAMLRLHFSRSIRKAELARSRSSTVVQTPEAGSIVYFWRVQKYNSKTAPAKRKLNLRRWHGPALVVAQEGPNLYLSFKGQLTKCAAEHVRMASSMEQIAAETWRDAIEEAVEAALLDMTRRGVEGGDDGAAGTLTPGGMSLPGTPGMVAPGTPVMTPRPVVDLPEVEPGEMVSALAGATAGAMRSSPSTPLPSSLMASRRTSLLSGAGASSRLGNVSSRMDPLVERARDVERDRRGQPREKRPPELDSSQLHSQQQQEAVGGPQATSTAGDAPQPYPLPSSTEAEGSDTLMVEMNEILEACAINNSQVHPLFRVQAQAWKDRLDPSSCLIEDHGTWDGRWSLPMVTDWKGRSALGLPWPTGRSEFEVEAVQASRKEYFWRNMSEVQKHEYRQAAVKGWDVWVQNEAVVVLEEKEAARIRAELQRRDEMHKILTPRFVYTDKHDGLRTKEKELPILASARLVVPGFRDVTAYTIRKDAPTASRISQHLVLMLTSCNYGEGWRLWSADIKSAFLKGDPYMSGARELYVGNIKNVGKDEPTLPFGPMGLAKVRKGVFGLADAPRQWYLRLNRSLVGRGWKRSMMDAACWMLWSDTGELEGVICSHVDDLLLGGNPRAQRELKALGDELGFGSIEEGAFQYCGKYIKQDEKGIITITMKEYHENLKTVSIAVGRRKEVDSPLNPSEHKQLRAVLGSLQWLVAQLRFDMGFQLSTLQGEVPTIGTLIKANVLVKRFKEHCSFALTFKPFELKGSGLLVVADASLGNVMRSGGIGNDPMERMFSQASYFVLVADADLLAGREGSFAVLDARSHRLARVCRSTFGAELYSTEEAFDVGIYCRGVLAESRGLSLKARLVDAMVDTVPLTVVTDAKDVYDKGSSDTPSYGSQKSLAFSVSWLRFVLQRENTELKWTSTENMWVDAGTKDMSPEHIWRILESCRWCIKYSPTFVKQTVKSRKPTVRDELVVIGEPVDPQNAVFGHLLKLGDDLGWHFRDGVPVHVAGNARSFRVPMPRFEMTEYPERSSFGRFEMPSGQVEWRQLENRVAYAKLPNKQGLIGCQVGRLVTFFHDADDSPSSINKRYEGTENVNT